MSADLVGSTAFKANKSHSDLPKGKPSPLWVDEFRTFYKDLLIEVSRNYDSVIKAMDGELHDESAGPPRVWKTIGDEIIFCSRVRSIEHVAASVSGFLKALDQYSHRLEKAGEPLRLKGAGWLGVFPASNISIAVAPESIEDGTSLSENTEEFERAADETPNRFDFLGKGIDTGFRIAKNASEDRFVTSVQLGYVLARAATKKRFPHSFGYHGRESLKGVIDGAPYPVVSVDTERSEIKSKLKSREAALTGETSIQPHALCDFLKTFMEVSGIDLPCLGEGRTPWNGDWPESYLRYQKAFEENLEIDDANLQQVADAVDPDVPDDASLEGPKSFLDQIKPTLDNDAVQSPAPGDEVQPTPPGGDSSGSIDP